MMLIIFFILGVLFSYFLQIFDLGISVLTNKYTLSTAVVQSKIDNMNPSNEIEEKTPLIGFQYEPQEEYNEYDDE